MTWTDAPTGFAGWAGVSVPAYACRPVVGGTAAVPVPTAAPIQASGLPFAGRLRGIDVRGIDVRGIDVRGIDVRGIDVRGIDVQGIDVQGIDVQGIDVRGLDESGLALGSVLPPVLARTGVVPMNATTEKNSTTLGIHSPGRPQS